MNASRRRLFGLLCISWIVLTGVGFGSYPVSFTDTAGVSITLQARPQRVVSLVPGITEDIFSIGAGDAVVGITYHSILPPGTAGKTVVGGFFAPDPNRIAALHPDLIFYAKRHRSLLKRFEGKALLVNLEPRRMEDGFRNIEILGRIFGREQAAKALVGEQKRLLEVIREKVAEIPAKDRLRVMRIMGRRRLMAPGDDSFQNDFIRAAGGIPPVFGKKGAVVAVTPQEWRAFNPQAVYGCGGNRKLLALLNRPGLKEVDAVQQRRIFFFPCELTCRAASHMGYFVQWLSYRLYGDLFSDPKNRVLPERIVSRRSLPLDLPYVRRAAVVESDITDLRNKTLLIELSSPMKVLSTLEGERKGIEVVGNHYFPPPSWGLGHKTGLQGLRERVLRVLGLSADKTSLLFTGADMDNLAVVKKQFKRLRVYALVTAGVLSNAQRMSKDEGLFYEPGESGAKEKDPGTINILLLTNMRLTPRAMARAVITATEAKTAALWDLDVRSTFTPLVNPATGTGTDNILVVEGAGSVTLDASGGHTRLGQLIAQAVYEGVKRAVHLQNGLTEQRTVFQRLRERRISLWEICRKVAPARGDVLHTKLERLLLNPRYDGFLKSLMALDDAEGTGGFDDSAVDSWCAGMASEVAEKEISYVPEIRGLDTPLPPLLGKGLAALIEGLRARDSVTGRRAESAPGKAGSGTCAKPASSNWDCD